MIRVLVVDDHTIVRLGLQRLLEQTPGIEVAAVADRGDVAVELDAELQPDVVLMDVSMPGQSGIESTRQICANRRAASVVMLTAATDRQLVIEALNAGAVGYLVKDADPLILVEGVRAAANGEAPIDPRAARFLLDNRRVANATNLTDRELQVLRLVGGGLANKAIARKLGISDKTVKAHLTRVYAELGVADRTQAALWASTNLDHRDEP